MARVTPTLIALGFYVLATATVFSPQTIASPGKIFYGNVDSLLILSTLEWERIALFTNPSALFDGIVYFPFAGTLFYTHLMLGALPVYVPLATLLGASSAFAALIFLMPILNAIAMYAAVRLWLRSWWPAFIAGFVFAFNPLQLHYSQFAHLAAFWWTPLALASWFYFLRRPSWWTFAGAWFLVFVQFSTGIYLGFIALTLLIVVIGSSALSRTLPWRNRSLVTHSLLASIAATLPFLPLLWGYIGFWLDHQEVRSLAEASVLSARLQNYTSIANLELHWYGSVGRDLGITSLGFPGIVALATGPLGLGLGIYHRGHRATSLALGIGGFLMFIWSLGPDLWWDYERTGAVLPYAWTHTVLPGFAALRNPSFLSLGMMTALALLTAVGIARIAHTNQPKSPWVRHGIPALILTLLIIESVRVPAVVGTLPHEPELQAALQTVPNTPAMFVPVGAEFTSSEPNTERLWWSVKGRNMRLVNGYSGFEPQGSQYLARLVDFAVADTQSKVVEAMASLGVRTLILDRNHLTNEQMNSWEDSVDTVDPGATRTATSRFTVRHLNEPIVTPHRDWSHLNTKLIVHEAEVGTSLLIPVALMNSGSVPWIPPGEHRGRQAEAHWYTMKNRSLTSRSEVMLLLPPVIPARSSAQVLRPVNLDAPPAPGQYELEVHIDGVRIAAAPVTIRAKPHNRTTVGVRAELEVYTKRPCVRSGERAMIRVAATNTGSTTWDSTHRLGTEWSTPDDRFILDDLPTLEGRLTVPYNERNSPWASIPPGSGFIFEGPIPTPSDPGTYRLRIGLVEENVGWFNDQDHDVVVLPPNTTCADHPPSMIDAQ